MLTDAEVADVAMRAYPGNWPMQEKWVKAVHWLRAHGGWWMDERKPLAAFKLPPKAVAVPEPARFADRVFPIIKQRTK